MLAYANPQGHWNLQSFWFLLIAILWIGYFVLEGFDFGVGILQRVIGRDAEERGTLIHTIGPVWDGNEVWLLVAGGATFAAFPVWYATTFSAFYLALFVVLVGLIVRGVAIEYRNKRTDEAWRSRWDTALAISSAVPALLWGVAFADFVHGVPINAQGTFTGNFFDLVGPYALLGGVTSLVLFTFHGALFLTLRTRGDLETRARATGMKLALPAALLVLAFLVWTYVNAVHVHDKGIVPGIIPISAIALPFVAWGFLRAGKTGWAFVSTALSIALVTATLFLNLYPRVLVSSTNNAYSLTIYNTSSSHYTLTVMSIVALLLTPVVLLYQAWTYWVFRARLGGEESPLDRLARSPIGSRSQ
ncbi:MAG TPA: cytochrome d ubiquinol oxidase subunit II [Gaiellaceae bacterium]|nr:cytochrome d ubiquinol oxidase subunit II [Gaiellaceae bacterium]